MKNELSRLIFLILLQWSTRYLHREQVKSSHVIGWIEVLKVESDTKWLVETYFLCSEMSFLSDEDDTAVNWEVKVGLLCCRPARDANRDE